MKKNWVSGKHSGFLYEIDWINDTACPQCCMIKTGLSWQPQVSGLICNPTLIGNDSQDGQSVDEKTDKATGSNLLIQIHVNIVLN